MALALAAQAAISIDPAGALQPSLAFTPVPLGLFVHPGHGGGWTSRPIAVDLLSASAPSLASGGGTIVLAQRAADGDVSVSEGTLGGGFSTTDLTATAGAPAAAGRPAVWMGPHGAVSIWYRSSTGDLVVASSASPGTPWAVTDVTATTTGLGLAGDPALVASGGRLGVAAYAVSVTGTIVEVTDTTGKPGGWVEADPTDGLAFPPLVGSLDVQRAPGDGQAVVVLATALGGDVVELSDEAIAPTLGVSSWHETDLTEGDRVPGTPGTLQPASPGVPDVAYRSWSGDVIALTLSSGLPSGVTVVDLTETSEEQGAAGAQPTVALGPSGPAVAVRGATGDLLLASIASTPQVADVSFQQHTGVLTESDAGFTRDGTAEVLVTALGAPIAPAPLLRRIALLATSFDQQHGSFVTTPSGSDCNPFTATYGRGSTYGCPRGDAAEEWCSDFADWVWQTSGVPTRGITGWAATFITWGRKHHRVQMGRHFTPEVGDAIVWGTRTPLYGTHVAIIVAVQGPDIDIVSGNAGGDFPGYVVGVWRSGPFDAATSTVNGYPVLGVVRP